MVRCIYDKIFGLWIYYLSEENKLGYLSTIFVNLLYTEFAAHLLNISIKCYDYNQSIFGYIYSKTLILNLGIRRVIMFGKRKAEKPKSPLGIVLYEYDLIIKTELKDILESIKQGRNLMLPGHGKLSTVFFPDLICLLGISQKTI